MAGALDPTLTIARAIALTLALVLLAPLVAQGFDAPGFFGDDFKPAQDRKDAGTLSADLGVEPPDWMDFTGSGTSRVRGRFAFTADGLVVRPDSDHGTCEALLDVGVSRAAGSVTLHELDQGGAFGFHLRDLSEPDRAWLIELRHLQGGAWQLRIRARANGGRYVAFPDSRRDFEKLDLPAEFKFEFQAGALSAEVGGHESSAKIGAENGASLGLAVTDARARLRDLKLDVTLHPSWMRDAAQRLLARRTLERLREYATTGLLAGIATFEHPGAGQALEVYSETERRDRAGPGGDPFQRAEVLSRIARAHPDSAFAQHEAGVAAMLAGQVSSGHALLAAADKLLRTPVTGLALAEACRRMGDISSAERALQQARKDLPDALKPECALIEGRLLADRGDIAGAKAVLQKAAADHAGHPQLQAFADSAAVLIQPPTLHALELQGPLGLRLVSDLPDELLAPVLEQLKPYIEKIRLWLPELPDTLEGVLAVFASPVEYLRAALLVAGDNLDNVAGMYLPHGIGGNPSVMACRAFGEDELLRTLVHELWHLALAATGRAGQLPRWLNEGMAVFLSAGRIEQGVMVYDELPSEFAAFGDAPLEVLSPERLKSALAARPHEFYVPGEVRGNYLAAWAVVWFHASRSEDLQLVRDLLKGNGAAIKPGAELHAAMMKALQARLR